jgi:uncharacterized protein (TIGR00369 family)
VRTLVSDAVSGAELRDRIPFAKELGIELLLGEDGRSKLQLEVLPQHLNGWGAVHGGVTMTALDVAMAVAARSLEPDGKGVVTIEMKTSFMQAGPPQGRLSATGTCVHRSSSMAFCEAEIRDEGDRLVARATGTFKFLRHRVERSERGAGDRQG